MENPHDTLQSHGEVLHDRINALVDGRLPPARAAELEAQLGEDAAARETLRAWKAQREALRSLHRPLLDEAIPDTLLAAARRGQAGKQQIEQWWRWGGMVGFLGTLKRQKLAKNC